MQRSWWDRAALIGWTVIWVGGCAGVGRDIGREQRAIRAAEDALKPAGEFRRACTTRLRDGYVFTFQRRPHPNVEITDSDPWPIVVVPDARSLRIVYHRYPPVARSSRTSMPMDSVSQIAAARRLTSNSVLHCYMRLSRGAFVELLPAGSSTAEPLTGVTIGVDSLGDVGVIGIF